MQLERPRGPRPILRRRELGQLEAACVELGPQPGALPLARQMGRPLDRAAERLEPRRLEIEYRRARVQVRRQLFHDDPAEGARAGLKRAAVGGPPARQLEHALAHDALEAEVGGGEAGADRDRHGRGGHVGQLHRPARGEVTIAQGAVAEPERGELEGGGGSGGGRGGRRPWRGRRLPERVDVHGARLRAHQVHHRRLDEDAIDDQPAAHERQELQPELDLARREEGLPRPQRGLLRDRDARERDARPAADGEAEALGRELASEPLPHLGEQPIRVRRGVVGERGERHHHDQGHARRHERDPPEPPHPSNSS